jgi:hypothetical protein
MKPKNHIYSDFMEKVVEKANELAFIIELTISIFASDQYKVKTCLKRWTDCSWYCYTKFGPWRDLLLITVELLNEENAHFDLPAGFRLRVYFENRGNSNRFYPSEAVIRKFAQQLSIVTAIPVEVLGDFGRWFWYV